MTHLNTSTVLSGTRLRYDGWHVMAERSGVSGTTSVRTCLWGADLSGAWQQTASGVGGLLVLKTLARVAHFASYDGKGSLTLLADGPTGVPSAEYEYGRFGELIRATGVQAQANPFRFSTKYTDDETTHLYYGYRYYSPGLGRWLSRDPLTDAEGLDAAEAVGGMNLYGFCGADPISLFGNLGLAFYAIDGTATTAASRANAWQLHNETTERTNYYWRGPKDWVFGSDSQSIATSVYLQIESDFCAAKSAGTDLTINLTGWSRGAMIAVHVAQMLNSGIWCLQCGRLQHYTPVQVNWVGLFDAVAMTRNIGFSTSVPGNVVHFDHAIKTQHTGKQSIFPTWHFSGGNERAFNNENGSLTTHADIGMSVVLGNRNDAYPWMKGQAIAAGVSF